MKKIYGWSCAAIFGLVATTALAAEFDIRSKEVIVSPEGTRYLGDVEISVKSDSNVRFESKIVEQSGEQTVLRGDVKIGFSNSTISTQEAVVTKHGKEMHITMVDASEVISK